MLKPVSSYPTPTASLLTWYDRERRDLLWRAPPGAKPDPYHVWLSEVMLQQTTVKAVTPYFTKFTRLWPTVSDLANAPREDVLAAWAGLGYYARARNLHACAKVVADDHEGAFPETEAELLKLPGIGAYTAAAIAAIAFGEPTTVVDGNVERVMARLLMIDTPLPKAKGEVRDGVTPLVPIDRPGDFAQAMMDLGATICTPKSPGCLICPWQDDCAAFDAGRQTEFPKKTKKAPKPIRTGSIYVIEGQSGGLFVRTRADKGLLGGMTEFPGTEWTVGSNDTPPWVGKLSNVADAGTVAHIFTHFELSVTVFTGTLKGEPPTDWREVPLKTLHREALPSVMKKVVKTAFELA
ncbi:MAG: A/G-specific adenine glycosylase [Pseudomonadota bacterium]